MAAAAATAEALSSYLEPGSLDLSLWLGFGSGA